MKKLVLFVEGDADKDAALLLIKRLLSEIGAWDCLLLDPNPVRTGGLTKITGKLAAKWQNLLRVALKRHNVGAVLLLLDGDHRRCEDQSFCAFRAASLLASRACGEGAGRVFSVACVFALQEYESWLLAGIDSLAGVELPDGRPGVRADASVPEGDLELAPRDAKRAIGSLMIKGYKPALDQEPLTKVVNLNAIRSQNLRSFRRLENALAQLVDAVRTGKHIATPK